MNKQFVAGSMLVLLLGVAQFVAAAEQHEHKATETSAGLELDHGQKWKSDAPLRQGMSTIHGRVQKLPADAAAAAALATAIRGDVDGIVKHCRLIPKADAVLHTILHDLLAGVERMAQAKTPAAREQGVRDVHRALANYVRHFEHPGWPRAD